MKYILSLVVLTLTACISLGPQKTLVQIAPGTDLASTEIGNGLESHTNVFNEVRISFTDLKFKKIGGCAESDSADDVSFGGNLVGNLLNGKFTPNIRPFNSPKEIDVCSFSFKLNKLEESETPTDIEADDEIIGYSVIIKGEHNNNPFEFKVDTDAEIELSQGNDGISLEGEMDIIIAFELSKLLDGINFESLDATGGVVFIDASNNVSAYNHALGNLINNIKLVKDENANGRFDDGDILLGE